MAAASDYLEDKVLDHVLDVAAYAQPAALYVGLFTADTGLEANNPSAEVTGNGYARTVVAFNAAASGSSTNNGAVTFPTASGGNWGTITYAAVMDAASSGNVLFYGALSVAKTVTDGDTFQISNAQLTITMA